MEIIPNAKNMVVRDGVGMGICVCQTKSIEIKRVYVEHPLLVLIWQGTKILRCAGNEYLIRPGEAVAVADGQAVDVINKTGIGGDHCSCTIAFDGALLNRNAELFTGRAVIAPALHLPGVSAGFARAVETALNAISDQAVPQRIARHQVSELLLWLNEYGACFRPEKAPTLTVKIRRHIGQNASKEWNASSLAAAFAMSEATLRRKLASENTSVVEIVTDIRMSCALKLLQSTTQSVARISQAVGYESPSHFSKLFRQRFGFTPTTLREREQI